MMHIFIDTFRTCARTRAFDKQILGPEFYKLEAVEPLFAKEKILSVHSLHKYYSVFEMFKIIKLREPYSMYSLFSRSKRRDDLLITSEPASLFTYHSAHTWNNCRKASSRIDFTEPISLVKNRLKLSLLNQQKEVGPYVTNFSF